MEAMTIKKLIVVYVAINVLHAQAREIIVQLALGEG